MKIKVFARPGAQRTRMFADCGKNMIAAEKLARKLAKDDFYSNVKIVEIPDAAEFKPYKKKETIYKP